MLTNYRDYLGQCALAGTNTATCDDGTDRYLTIAKDDLHKDFTQAQVNQMNRDVTKSMSTQQPFLIFFFNSCTNRCGLAYVGVQKNLIEQKYGTKQQAKQELKAVQLSTRGPVCPHPPSSSLPYSFIRAAFGNWKFLESIFFLGLRSVGYIWWFLGYYKRFHPLV